MEKLFSLTLLLLPVFASAVRGEDAYTWSFKDVIETEHIVSTRLDQNPADADKKNELKNRIELQYGSESFYIITKCTQAAVLSPYNKEYPYSDEIRISRNGRVSGRSFELNFNELYINAGFEKIRLRAGNQIYGWGTSDVFNPTSYFNPYDLRELIYKQDADTKNGVPSLSSLFYIGDYTLECVAVPAHIPSTYADRGAYWAIQYQEGPFPVNAARSSGMDIAFCNAGYGTRFSGTFFGIDASASAYYGPDKEPALRPFKTEILPNQPVSITVRPEYRNLFQSGFDFSAKFSKFVIQGECVYSPDKTAVVSQPYDSSMTLPFELRRTQAVTYTAGFNYFIPLSALIEGHEGTTVFTMEWMQSILFGKGLMDPMLTDILTCRLEDSFLSDRLKTSCSAVIDTKKKGITVFPKIGWDFQNGFSFEASYVYIKGRKGSVFGYYTDNDFVSVRGRYEF